MTEKIIKRGSAMQIAFRPDTALSSVKKMQAVFSQGEKVITKECEADDDNVYYCRLTQKDTLSFLAGELIEIELKALLASGDVLLSEVFSVECVKGLSGEVIE